VESKIRFDINLNRFAQNVAKSLTEMRLCLKQNTTIQSAINITASSYGKLHFSSRQYQNRGFHPQIPHCGVETNT